MVRASLLLKSVPFVAISSRVLEDIVIVNKSIDMLVLVDSVYYVANSSVIEAVRVN